MARRILLEPTRSEIPCTHVLVLSGNREIPRLPGVGTSDDSSWKVGGEPAQLMVFDTNRETVYRVRPPHRDEEVRELVPADDAGTPVTDRGVSYEAAELRVLPRFVWASADNGGG